MAYRRQQELVIPYEQSQKSLIRLKARSAPSTVHTPKSCGTGSINMAVFQTSSFATPFFSSVERVLMSDPDMPNEGGYILTHYAGKREAGHPAFKRMATFFSSRRISELVRQCDRLKNQRWGNRGGGDPDLFVVSPNGRMFFVEVKDKDHLTPKQTAIFRKISALLRCEVRVARIKAVPGTNAADALREQLTGHIGIPKRRESHWRRG